jgi:hypothetical protein
MTNRLNYLLLAFVLMIFAAGCGEDEDPLIENEEEVITSVTLTFTPFAGATETVVYGFSDPDGDGGSAPNFSYTGVLQAGAVYSSQVSFGNETGTIDAEIVAEGADHQVFIANTADILFAYNDTDANGDPLGLLTTANVTAAGTGSLTLTLRHEPVKSALIGITSLDVAGGETDVEVTFDVTIQ